MILVDSNIWIDSLRGKITPEVEFFFGIQQDLSEEVCLSRIIYFEVLRGITNDLERKRAQKVLDGFTFYNYHNEDFSDLISIYRSCQKKGLNLPRLGDWLIFKTVVDHGLKLLTADSDFYRIAAVHPFGLIRVR